MKILLKMTNILLKNIQTIENINIFEIKYNIKLARICKKIEEFFKFNNLKYSTIYLYIFP